jgi:hypothetical protein
MTETTTERLAAIVSTFEESLFERLDKQHAKGIHDDEVIRFLRNEGHTLLAERYIEWSGALDPDREDDNTTMNPVVPDPADSPSYAGLAEQLAGVQRIREAHERHFPVPSDRNSLQHEIDQLQKEYIGKFHTDPVFHAKAKLAANFLDQLESVHQLGDSEHAGFLLAAVLDKGVQA